MKDGILVKRGEFLRWLQDHKDIAKEYSQYDGKHANLLWDFNKELNEYVPNDFVCSNYCGECGHPMIAHCYSDSYRCSMCDAKELSD